jgi:hypothetical protein
MQFRDAGADWVLVRVRDDLGVESLLVAELLREAGGADG